MQHCLCQALCWAQKTQGTSVSLQGTRRVGKQRGADGQAGATASRMRQRVGVRGGGGDILQARLSRLLCPGPASWCPSGKGGNPLARGSEELQVREGAGLGLPGAAPPPSSPRTPRKNRTSASPRALLFPGSASSPPLCVKTMGSHCLPDNGRGAAPECSTFIRKGQLLEGSSIR